MLRKSTMFRLLCLTLLAALASFGALTITAQPAQALWCAPTFFGCEFSHVGDFGTAICCVYQCPNGNQRIGVCEQVW
jgi:hypothetical protein